MEKEEGERYKRKREKRLDMRNEEKVYRKKKKVKYSERARFSIIAFVTKDVQFILYI
jgi:hypothetical protein